MLSLIRERFSKIILLTILGLLTLSMGIWGIQSSFTSPNRNNPTLVKDGQVSVSKRQFDFYLRNRVNSLTQAQRKQLSTSKELRIVFEQQLLTNLLADQKLLFQLQHQGYDFSPKLLSNHLSQDLTFYNGDVFSNKKFQYFLRSQGLNEHEYLANLGFELMLDQLDHGLAESALTRTKQHQSIMGLVQQQRVVNCYQPDMLSSPKLTNEMLKNFYQKHENLFMAPKKITMNFLVYSAKDLIKSIQTTDAQIVDFYNQHLDWYQQAESVQLHAIGLSKVAKPTRSKLLVDFAKKMTNIDETENLLAHYDLNPAVGSKKKWMVVSSLQQAIRNSVQSLAIGQVSSIVQTERGPMIFQVLQRKAAQPIPLSKITERVKHDYINSIVQKKYYDMVERMKDIAFTSSKTLRPLAKLTGNPVLTQVEIEQGNPKSYPKQLPPTFFHTQLFSSDLPLNVNSRVIDLGNDQVVVYQVTKRQAKHVQSFSKVKSRVSDLLAKSERQRLSYEAAKKLLHQLKLHQKLDRDQSDIKVDKNIVFNYGVSQNNKLYDTLAPSVFKLSFKVDEGLSMVEIDPEHYVVLQLTQLKHQSKSDHTQQQNQLVDDFMLLDQDMDYYLFKRALLS